jgi:hypothetical protein
MVSPPPDVGNNAPVATSSRAVASTPERGAAPSGGAAPALDLADIKPLDVPAALQILIAEVRESFVRLLIEAGDAAASGDGGGAGTTGAGATAGAAMAGVWPSASVDNPTSAARVLVEMMLQALPDTTEEAAWNEVLPRADAALQSAIQRAVDVVSAWRDVPPGVVQTTRESAGLALQVLGDEPQNPLWLRPEWLTMTPRLARFWRRRRVLRCRLTDPDYDTDTQWDEGDDYTI